MSDRTGTRFGPYQLVQLLGRGGMGEVYRAHDLQKDREVAVKLLPPHLATDPDYERRFEREAHTAASVTDPHVVPIHNYGRIDGVLFLEMPMVQGEDLRSIVRREGALSPERAVAIVEQIAGALDAAHAAGLTHRDVKPENVLVTSGDFCYLADFGIASRADDTRVTEDVAVVGSLRYMAPERFGDAPATPAADTYGLACIAYELLTGRQAFASRSVASITREQLTAYPPASPEQVPEPMWAVLRQALDKEPARRPASSGELAVALRAALPQQHARHRLSRAQWIAAAVGFLLAIGAGAAVGVRVLGGGESAAVVLMPADQTSAHPFTRSVVTDKPSETVRRPYVRRGAGASTGGGAAPTSTAGLSDVASERGSAPGLYGVPGGTTPPCDTSALVRMITRDPTRASVWAGLLGTTPAEIESTVADLTPLILRVDTLVVNSDYKGGKAVQYPAVLQAGTAVLVDRYGLPRVKCNCGNPLAEAAKDVPLRVTGSPWRQWSGHAVRIRRTTSPMTSFEVVRITSGEKVTVPAGTYIDSAELPDAGTATSSAHPTSTGPTGSSTASRGVPGTSEPGASTPPPATSHTTSSPAPTRTPPPPSTHESTVRPPVTTRPPRTLTQEPPTYSSSPLTTRPPRTLTEQPPKYTPPAVTTRPPRTLTQAPPLPATSSTPILF